MSEQVGWVKSIDSFKLAEYRVPQNYCTAQIMNALLEQRQLCLLEIILRE